MFPLNPSVSLDRTPERVPISPKSDTLGGEVRRNEANNCGGTVCWLAFARRAAGGGASRQNPTVPLPQPIVAPIPRRITGCQGPHQAEGSLSLPSAKGNFLAAVEARRIWPCWDSACPSEFWPAVLPPQTHPGHAWVRVLTWLLGFVGCPNGGAVVCVVGPVSGQPTGLARMVVAIAKPAGLQGRVSRLGLLGGLGISRGLRDPDRRVSSPGASRSIGCGTSICAIRAVCEAALVPVFLLALCPRGGSCIERCGIVGSA